MTTNEFLAGVMKILKLSYLSPRDFNETDEIFKEFWTRANSMSRNRSLRNEILASDIKNLDFEPSRLELLFQTDQILLRCEL